MNQNRSLLTFMLSYVPETLASRLLGRLPHDHESNVIAKLRALINTPYEDSSHEDDLRRIFVASGVEGVYSSTGQHWKQIGFQQLNPASDIRGGGLLSLQCITYFLEKRPSVGLAMLKRRFRIHGEDGGYPWATAGIVLTRLLAAIFGVIQMNGAPVRQQEKQVYWHLLQSEEDFYRLFCCMFELLDQVWEQEQATYMEFPRIQAITEQQFRGVLARMPESVAVVEGLVNLGLVEDVDYMSLPEEYAKEPTEEKQKADVPTTDDLIFTDYDYNYEDDSVAPFVPTSSLSSFWLDNWPADEQLVASNTVNSLRYRNPVIVV